MKFSLSEKPTKNVKVIPFFEGDKTNFKNEEVSNLVSENPKFGKLFDSQLFYLKNEKLLLLGAGKKEKFSYETLQNWVGAAVKSLNKNKEISILLPEFIDSNQITAAVVGAEIASFDPAAVYKSEPEKNKLIGIEFVLSSNPEIQKNVKESQMLADSINLVRELGDMPANLMTPTYFLNETKKIAKANGLKLTVLNERQARQKGMGAFVGVAQGSDEPSFMIAIEYSGNKSSKEKWGLVGKGITYDTGGLSLKPSESMYGMKYDMSGAATVLGSVLTLAKLKVKANVVGVMAVTENALSAKPQMPGDIIKSYSGKSVEVVNTDAEGRLVLMDGLSFAQKDFKATKLVDIATLTGAIIVALGHVRSGVFSNNSQFAQKLIEAGAKVGEKFWELPMDEEYEELIKSDFADMANAGFQPSARSGAGSIFGAKFLEKVIEGDRAWIHLDIAGTSDDSKAKPYRGVGATGVGVKTLVELIKE